jgi:hypothetical protein
MARKHDAERLLTEGLYPSLIAARMGISVSSVIQYLCTRVGEGALRLSDIYFSWPSEKRDILQHARHNRYPNLHDLRANELSREELELFEELRKRGVFSGDMYDYVSDAEITVHRLVRTILEQTLGTDEKGWWREGVPASIREKCASRREVDDELSKDAYVYTTLIDLSNIMSKRWDLFQQHLPKEYASNRKQLETDFLRLNGIRNAVMHP